MVCTSLNQEIVHGIPGERELQEGDLLKLDFGVIFEGFHGDSAVAVQVGEPDPEVQRLQDATLRSLSAGIAQMQPGNRPKIDLWVRRVIADAIKGSHQASRILIEMRSAGDEEIAKGVAEKSIEELNTEDQEILARYPRPGDAAVESGPDDGT